MPDQLYSLTLSELHLLYWHKAREDRREHYNAYLNAWWPNHREGDRLLTETELWPLPCDPEIEEYEVDEEEERWWVERGLKPPPRSEGEDA